MTTNIKTKHTPGPWQMNKLKGGVSFNIRGGQDSVAAVYAFVGSPVLNDRVYEGEANARLIAAAPELLEALKGMVNALNSGLIAYNTSPEHCQFKVNADAAIQKATGESI